MVRHYATTWMLFDLGLISMDWAFFIAAGLKLKIEDAQAVGQYAISGLHSVSPCLCLKEYIGNLL